MWTAGLGISWLGRAVCEAVVTSDLGGELMVGRGCHRRMCVCLSLIQATRAASRNEGRWQVQETELCNLLSLCVSILQIFRGRPLLLSHWLVSVCSFNIFSISIDLLKLKNSII